MIGKAKIPGFQYPKMDSFMSTDEQAPTKTITNNYRNDIFIFSILLNLLNWIYIELEISFCDKFRDRKNDRLNKAI